MEFILVISYLLGSVPFGLILSKLFLGVDVRNVGSNNIGATNVMRLGNKKIAALTLFLDGFKSFLAIKIASYFGYENIELCGLLSVMGHVFPIWLRFKGGKGVASFLGMIFALNYIIAICFIFSWLVIYKISKISALSAIIAIIISIISYFYIDGKNHIFIMILTGIIVICRHYSNIIRMIRNEELKI